MRGVVGTPHASQKAGETQHSPFYPTTAIATALPSMEVVRICASMEPSKSPTKAVHGEHEILLRSIHLDDVDDMLVWETDPKVAQFCRWWPYMTREKAIDAISNWYIPHPYHRVICVNNRAVGRITVTKNSGEDSCRGELGYVVASGWWGKGIATVAVKLVVSTIFEEWPQLERLEALVDVENYASQRVVEKAGFSREGVLRRYLIMKERVRDMVVFSVLRSDPKPVL